MSKHKHHDVIIAFAKGARVQVSDGFIWLPMVPSYDFDDRLEYRVDPADYKFERVAAMSDDAGNHWTATASNYLEETDIENLSFFERWINNRVYKD